MSPAKTLERVTPLLAAFGITRVARHTGLDCIGIPVWCAYAPNARSIVVAQGKGLSDDDAKVSAVMEALERAVAAEPAVQTVFATPKSLCEAGQDFERLDSLIGQGKDDIAPDDDIEWAAARELLSGRQVHVPYEAAILDQTRDSRFWMSSDGLASGNTLDEAIFHGILERIERDAYILWQVGSDDSRYARCVDPAGFGDPELDGLLAKILSSDLSIKLFDITSDIGIPCFSALLAPKAVLHDPNVRFVEVTGGSGAHPSPIRAAIRAITEAVQSRLTYISGARDDISPETFSERLPEQTRSAFAALPRLPTLGRAAEQASLGEHLDHVLCALKTRQIGAVIALPLSAPSLPFSVVKIFIPALENPAGNRARRFGPRAIAAAILT
ncbi:YcaO-like family protein [Rhizobium sp. S152]|uniref:YcaO-like family protein n=1 Tax=Rhizobium sp. S152 TaxID=3055038 RepID=UPI0025A9B50C|nr:YcaO-like family protein [Rhizobium sp. S152]MDM9625517.1 YcaO-like family protein [Rhizobium sp. S152]